MTSSALEYFCRANRMPAALLISLAGLGSFAMGENPIVEPVYRVANETATGKPLAAVASAAAPAAAPASVPPAFDFVQQPGEQPLAPVIRLCQASIEEIDHNVHDYSCTFVKQERIDGDLGEPQHIFMKVRHEPFSVYMSFLNPYPGREVLYVADQNDGDLVVMEAGWKRKLLGKMNLDPEGARAMSGQRHPITRVGIRNLTMELTRRFEEESRYGECEVLHKADPQIKISGRPATMVQITHPIPRQTFRAYICRLFFDNELRIPIHFDAYLWPEQQGGPPPLDESYTYTNLKTNNGYTARDFDANNNPEIFKP